MMRCINKNNNNKSAATTITLQMAAKPKNGKPKNKVPHVQLAVVAAKPGRSKKPMASKTPGYCGLYRTSVLNPFAPRSRGIKAPDGFMFPTITKCLKGKFTVGSNANGIAAIAAICNPVISIMDLPAFNSASPSISSAGSLSQFGLNTSIYGGTAAANLVNDFESYRVVAAGVKLKVVMPELTRTGIVTCAPFISLGNTPGINAITGAGMTNPNSYSTFLGGILPGVAGSGAILELPGAFEVSMTDLGREAVILPFKPASSISSVFHGTDVVTSYNATQFVASNELITGLGVASSATNTDVANAAGFTGWIIFIDGLPVTTSNILVVEYVYHLEGVPSIAGGTVAVPVSDSTPTPSVRAVDYLQALRDISESPLMEFASMGLEAMGVGSSRSVGRYRGPY
jgi:hypothetical protein